MKTIFKFISYLLTAAFVVAIPALAATGPKVGIKCTKAGQIIFQKNVKFICSKSGKNLIWKSQPIATPAPSSSPSSPLANTPSPSSSPSQQINSRPSAGSACENIGARIPAGFETFLECRMVVGGKLKFFNIQNGAIPPTNVTPLGDIKDCQVPDQTKRDPGATPIGYKTNRYQNPSYPTEGQFKIVILPIDFNDVPGAPLNISILDRYVKIIEKWFDYESNGKLKVEVTYVDKWLRAPKPSQKYNWNHPGTQNPTNLTNDEIGQDFVNISDSYVNYRNVGALFIMHPDRIRTIEYGMTANAMMQTAEGAISPFISANGYEDDRQDGALWAYWIHEFMHHVGITGHAPDELWALDLMNLQSGFGLSTSTWNQLLLDWLPPNQIYCRKIENLKSEVVTLTSIDSLQVGIKSAMIAMSSHEVLVIESRRKDFWTTSVNTMVNKEVYDGFYGVTIYIVDTTRVNSDIETDRNAPDYDSSKYKFAWNLKVSKDHLSEFKGVSGLEYIMLEGEKLMFRNVQISFLESGNFDTIKVEKI